jgi:hypothetical protein
MDLSFHLLVFETWAFVAYSTGIFMLIAAYTRET